MADSDELNMKFCGNCKKDISAVNFVMHEAHCFRHIVLCKDCGEPIPKAEVEQHFRDQHEKIPCEKCGQRVEKMHLEQHENNDCPKKPQKCLYCDLEFPKSDLKSHLDYCGSRTEQCPKCSQFILFRDQLKHEEADCAYPIPKVTADNSSANDLFNFFGDSAQAGMPFGYTHSAYGDQSPQEQISPFVLDEMNRFLNNRPGAPRRLTSDMADFVGHNASYFQPLERRNEISQPKRNNFDTWQSRAGQDQFVDTEDLTSPSGSADGNLDYLLALHLAQDLNSTDGHRGSINTYQGDDGWEPLVETTQRLSLTEFSPVAPHTQGFSTVTQSTVEEAEIPCEFCGEPFPADMVVQHQSGCELHLSPSHSHGEVRDRGRPSDINSSRPLATQSPVQIPIVNNLGFTGPPAREAEIPDALEHEDTMLPCEFCKALLPLEFLVQHQAVCEAESAPRLDTPNTPPPPPAVKAKVKNSNITRKEKVSNIARSSNVPRSRSNRHQEDPNLQMFNISPAGREKAMKTLNLRNVSSNGANIVTGQESFVTKVKVNREAVLPSQSGSRRRQPLSQTENISSHDPGQRPQTRPHEELFSSSLLGNSSDEDLLAESAASAAVIPKQASSRKAVKQRNNREKQTGSQRGALGDARLTRASQHRELSDEGAANGMSFQPSVRGLSSRQPPSRSLVGQSASQTSSRQPQSSSSVRHPVNSTSSSNPRRSGNQVFAGPGKRTTPKRRLPDPPS